MRIEFTWLKNPLTYPILLGLGMLAALLFTLHANGY
jgi:uncharacterized protein (DUF2062 family)